MKLIIEAGASRSDWIVIDNQVLEIQQLPGINPTAMPDTISILESYYSQYNDHINEVYFYGAGVSNEGVEESLDGILSRKYPTSNIDIDSDIIAACRSTYTSDPCIVSILGTGVNTAIYDGTNIISKIESLGYLIEEEGSGFNIGKLIAKKYLRSEMSHSDKQIFIQMFQLENIDLKKMIYGHAQVNFLIASFSTYLNYCSKALKELILAENFNNYTKNHIQKIDDYRHYKVNFVGSIAFAFQNELKKSMNAIDASIGKILKSPLDGLIKYHLNN